MPVTHILGCRCRRAHDDCTGSISDMECTDNFFTHSFCSLLQNLCRSFFSHKTSNSAISNYTRTNNNALHRWNRLGYHICGYAVLFSSSAWYTIVPFVGCLSVLLWSQEAFIRGFPYCLRVAVHTVRLASRICCCYWCWWRLCTMTTVNDCANAVPVMKWDKKSCNT